MAADPKPVVSNHGSGGGYERTLFNGNPTERSSFNNSKKTAVEDNEESSCCRSNCKKIGLIALTVVAVLGAAAAGYVCQEHLGQFVFAFVTGGAVLFLALKIIMNLDCSRKVKEITKYILKALAALTLIAAGGATVDALYSGSTTETIFNFFKERAVYLAGGLAGGVIATLGVAIFKTFRSPLLHLSNGLQPKSNPKDDDEQYNYNGM